MNWMVIVGALFLIGGVGNITRDLSTAAIALVIGVVLMYLGLRKMGVISKQAAAKPAASAGEAVEETFYVVGTTYYKENIGKLACRNEEWSYTAAQAIKNGKLGKPIYRYTYINKPVKLVPEPKNQHDKNAVAVYIAGELVGYIKREENLHVKELLSKRKIESITASVCGGEHKIAQEDKTFQRHDDGIGIRVWITYR